MKYSRQQAIRQLKQVVSKHSFDEEDEKETVANEIIPRLQKGGGVTNQETKVEAKQTKALLHFSEGTLIEAMKTVGKLLEDEAFKKVLKNRHGIGTEATRANIIEILFKRGYLERKAKQVISTKKGRALIDLVPDVMKNPVLTAQWEQRLEAMVDGHGDLMSFIGSQVDLLKSVLSQLRSQNAENKMADL